MNEITLQITDAERHRDILREADANGSLASLLCAIGYFLCASGKVILRPHGIALEYRVLLFWENDDKPYIVGDLIWHSSDNTWSTHKGV